MVTALWIGAALAWLGLASSAAISAWLLRRAAPPRRAAWPAISIIISLRGRDTALADNLAAALSVAYPGVREVIVVADDAADAAWGAVDVAQRAHPSVPLTRVVAGEAPPHWLPKTHSLARALAHAAHRHLVFAEADVRLDAEVLAQVVGAACAAPVGAAYACPVARGRGLAGRCDAAVTNFIALLAQPLLAALRIEPIAGALWATRRETLAAIGGLAAVADRFADDAALAQAWRAHGYALACATVPVRTVHGRLGWRQFAGHQLRWLRTWRLTPGPARGLALFFSPLSIGALAVLLDPSGWHCLGLLYLLEVGLSLAVARGLNRGRSSSREAPLTPLALLLEQLIAIAALFGRRVSWAGRDYELLPDGRFRRLQAGFFLHRSHGHAQAEKSPS